MSNYIQGIMVNGSKFWEGKIFVDITTHVDGQISGSVNFKLTPEEAVELVDKLIAAQGEVKARAIEKMR